MDCGASFGCHGLRVVGDDAHARREACPVAFGIDERIGNALRARRSIRCQHITRLQHERANGLVRPEHVGLRPRLLREETVRQAGRLRLLRVVDRVDLHARLLLVLPQHRLREDAIGRHVDGHRPASVLLRRLGRPTRDEPDHTNDEGDSSGERVVWEQPWLTSSERSDHRSASQNQPWSTRPPYRVWRRCHLPRRTVSSR